MEIRTEEDINGASALWLRERAGQNQTQFWERVGMTQGAGCRYERGLSQIPKPVRRLVFATYVAGVDLDTSTAEGGEKVMRLAKLQASENAAQVAATMKTVQTHLDAAGQLLKSL